MSVRVSPISRAAAILIMALGVFTFVFVNDIAGVVFIVLGVILYALLFRFTKRVEHELREAESPSS